MHYPLSRFALNIFVYESQVACVWHCNKDPAIHSIAVTPRSSFDQNVSILIVLIYNLESDMMDPKIFYFFLKAGFNAGMFIYNPSEEVFNSIMKDFLALSQVKMPINDILFSGVEFTLRPFPLGGDAGDKWTRFPQLAFQVSTHTTCINLLFEYALGRWAVINNCAGTHTHQESLQPHSYRLYNEASPHGEGAQTLGEYILEIEYWD